MSMEGFGWIPNLTVGDKSFILPATMASFNLAITEVWFHLFNELSCNWSSCYFIQLQTMSNTAPLSRLGKYRLYILRGLCLVIIPIAAYFPSVRDHYESVFFYRWLQFFGFLCLRMKGVTLYWTTSSAYGLVQNLILLSPKVRRKLRIPLTPSENTHPYRRIREKLLAKLKWVNQEKMKTCGINCVHSFSIKYVTILWCVKRIFMFSFAIFTCEAIFNLNDWNFMRITYLSEMNALT